MRRSLSAVLLVLFVLSGAAVTPAAAATAPSPTLHFSVSSRVAVLARGAALAVPVSYVCPAKYAGPTGYAIWFSEVQQTRADGTVVDGFDAGGTSADLTCDGALHQHEIVILPFGQDAYDAPSTATVTTGILACNAAETNCKQPTKTYPADLRTATAGDPANQPLDGSATLQPDGSVHLTLNTGCPAGTFAEDNATLTERVNGDQVATGESQTFPACNRTTTTFAIVMDSFRARTGMAYVIGDGRICSHSTCSGFRTFRGTVVIT
jgi:hypothetical protein